ncbi:hypothetical protein D3C86_1824280 [compost metagenome]
MVDLTIDGVLQNRFAVLQNLQVLCGVHLIDALVKEPMTADTVPGFRDTAYDFGVDLGNPARNVELRLQVVSFEQIKQPRYRNPATVCPHGQ